MSADVWRRKAEELLRQASQITNMNERGRLIDEAMHWHNLALAARNRPDLPEADDEGSDDGDHPPRGH